MKIRLLLLFSLTLLITFYGCLKNKEIPTNLKNSEEHTKNLKALNIPNMVVGIKYDFFNKRDTILLEKEYSNKYLSAERKKLLENSLDIIRMLKKYGKNDNPIRKQTFYFNKDSLAIVYENSENKTFSLIKTKKDSIFHYWTKESRKFYHKRNVTSKSLTNTIDSLRVVEIEELQNDRKNILGFNCYKVRIVVRFNSPIFNGEDFETFDVYLTDEIEDFPPHLIYAGRVFQVAYFPKIKGCALEIIRSGNETPHLYSIIRATEIVNNDSTIFEIPDSLRSAVRFYNTIHEEGDYFEAHVLLDSLECHGIY